MRTVSSSARKKSATKYTADAAAAIRVADPEPSTPGVNSSSAAYSIELKLEVIAKPRS